MIRFGSPLVPHGALKPHKGFSLARVVLMERAPGRAQVGHPEENKT